MKEIKKMTMEEMKEVIKMYGENFFFEKMLKENSDVLVRLKNM